MTDTVYIYYSTIKGGIHAKLEQRDSLTYHRVPGGYIGPSRDHYRSLKNYILLIQGTIDYDKIKFKPRPNFIQKESLDARL